MSPTPERLPWDTFASRELTTENAWWLRVFTWLNQLRDQANPFTTYWKGVQTTTGSNLTNAVWTQIPMNSLELDSDGLGINAGGFVAPVTGTYVCMGSGGLNATTGNRQGVQVGKNGAANNIDGSKHRRRTTGVGDSLTAGMAYVAMTAGDRLDLYGYQESGGTVTLSVGTARKSTLSVWRLT